MDYPWLPLVIGILKNPLWESFWGGWCFFCVFFGLGITLKKVLAESFLFFIVFFFEPRFGETADVFLVGRQTVLTTIVPELSLNY